MTKAVAAAATLELTVDDLLGNVDCGGCDDFL